MSIDKLKTKFFTGAWLTDVKHYFTKINEIIDYLNSLIFLEKNYIEYIAYITQQSTFAPYTIDLNNNDPSNPIVNEIDGTWSYESVGHFKYTPNVPGLFSNLSKIDISIIKMNENTHFSTYITPQVLDTNSITFLTTKPTTFGGSPVLGDDLLNCVRIHIKIYN